MAIERQFPSSLNLGLAEHVHFVRKSSPEGPYARRYKRIEEPDTGKSDSSRLITVNYNGTLSEKLDWRLDTFDKLAQQVDLRSDINITSSGELRGTGVYDSLGEVAVWRRLGNPMELFRRRLRTVYRSSVDTNEKSSTVEINVYDQEISASIRNKNNGLFNSDNYVQALNNEVRQNIQSSMNWEKLTQMRKSVKYITLIVGGTAAFGIVEGSAVYVAIQGSKDFLPVLKYLVTEPYDIVRQVVGKNEIYENESDVYYLSKIGLGTLKIYMGISVSFFGFYKAIEALKVGTEGLKAMNSRTSRYFRSLQDLNPLKHVIDLAKGSLCLHTSGKDLVNLKK